MFDIGWSELGLIAAVALIVIGPKDLPRALYTVGKWVRRARLMARDFQSTMDEMMRQAELDELKREVEKARNFNVRDEVRKSVDPDGTLQGALRIDDRMEPLDAPPLVPAPQPAPATVGALPATPGPAPDSVAAPVADGAVPASKPS